jgi:hypothetical protein
VVVMAAVIVSFVILQAVGLVIIGFHATKED